MGVKDVFKRGWAKIDKQFEKVFMPGMDSLRNAYAESHRLLDENTKLFKENLELKLESQSKDNKIELLQLEKDSEKSLLKTEIEYLKLETNELKFENQWLRDQLPELKRDVEFNPFDMVQDSQEIER